MALRSARRRTRPTHWFARTRILMAGGTLALAALLATLAFLAAGDDPARLRPLGFVAPLFIVGLVSALARIQERNDVRHGRPGLGGGTR